MPAAVDIFSVLSNVDGNAASPSCPSCPPASLPASKSASDTASAREAALSSSRSALWWRSGFTFLSTRRLRLPVLLITTGPLGDSGSLSLLSFSPFSPFSPPGMGHFSGDASGGVTAGELGWLTSWSRHTSVGDRDSRSCGCIVVLRLSRPAPRLDLNLVFTAKLRWVVLEVSSSIVASWLVASWLVDASSATGRMGIGVAPARPCPCPWPSRLPSEGTSSERCLERSLRSPPTCEAPLPARIMNRELETGAPPSERPPRTRLLARCWRNAFLRALLSICKSSEDMPSDSKSSRAPELPLRRHSVFRVGRPSA
mmetsp:Transcript_60368/g.136450  ORF Transcript_60368/g.136450 Transcript_60368/m.136450 type:complete len:313 (-) Transcript_60368:140-1078(-)